MTKSIKPLGDFFVVDWASRSGATTGLRDGSYVVTWTETNVYFSKNRPNDQNIFGQVFGPDGIPVDENFQVNSLKDGQQVESAVAALQDGGFVVTWTSDRQDGFGAEILGQRYDATGLPRGEEFTVNTYAAGSQDDSAVAALSDGGFIVTWTSEGQDGSDAGVFGQRYDASGLALGEEFTVNTYAAGSQNDSAVATLLDGGFIVTWTSEGQDGSDAGVFGQRYDANGLALGEEFTINTFTAGSQDDSAVAALSDGGFIVTWTSEGQDGWGGRVFGQRYDATGLALGEEFPLERDATGRQSTSALAAFPDSGFLATWAEQSGREIRIGVQSFGADGQPDGESIQIRTEGYTSEGDNVWNDSVSLLQDGSLISTWSSFYQSDSGSDTYRVESQKLSVDNLPDGELVIGGIVQVGEHVIADMSRVSDADGIAPNSLTYNWFRDGTVVAGATEPLFLLGDADIGTKITVRVRYSDEKGFGARLFSLETNPVRGEGENLFGTVGQDTLVGGRGEDLLVGYQGRDELHGQRGYDDIRGGSGNDKITGGGGSDILRGGWGNDQLFGNNGSDHIFGGEGNDALRGGKGNDVLEGVAGRNSIWGGSGRDKLLGGYGDDNLDGGIDDDLLYGGFGDDELIGGDGNDEILGEEGNDTLNGGEDNDRLFGSAGEDHLTGGNGDDVLDGGTDNDRLDGGNGRDKLDGGIGNDTLSGSKGYDTLLGATGDDMLDGGDGKDRLFGGDGNDTIFGGAGSDKIFGESGNDVLTGGSGHDRFVFSAGFDIITDFDATNELERVNLRFAKTIVDFNDLILNKHAQQVGADIVIDDFKGNTLTMRNVHLTDLDPTDFVF